MLVPVSLLLSPLTLSLDSLARPEQQLGEKKEIPQCGSRSAPDYNSSCSTPGLFKRGDGVNVYEENSYCLSLYYRCINRHLVEGGQVDSNIQVYLLLFTIIHLFYYTFLL